MTSIARQTSLSFWAILRFAQNDTVIRWVVPGFTRLPAYPPTRLPAYLRTTPQAIRLPELPEGCDL